MRKSKSVGPAESKSLTRNSSIKKSNQESAEKWRKTKIAMVSYNLVILLLTYLSLFNLRGCIGYLVRLDFS